ncbi:MAG: Ig-like domain-containing protein [Microbacteriaceae bacterium]
MRLDIRALARRRWLQATAGGVALAALVAGAVVANGYDVKRVPVSDPSVWALNQDATTGAQRYGRVNTELAELDTVKPATSPSSIVQTDDTVLVFTEDDLKYAAIDPAEPQNLATDDEALQSAPAGTASVSATGVWVAFLSSSGAVSVGVARDGALSTPTTIVPFPVEGDDATAYAATAVAIGTDGILYAYSADRGAVLAFDLGAGEVVDETTVSDVPEDPVPQLTAVGDEWLLFDGGETMWSRAHPEGVDVDLDGADTVALAEPAAEGVDVYAATSTALYAVDVDELEARAVVAPGAELGTPAAPVQLDGIDYAAWIPAGGQSGSYWHSDTGESTTLSFGGQSGSAAPAPAFRVTADELILNDSSVGWVWTRDGELVASSQDWDAGDPDQTQVGDDAQETEVVDPMPPTAENDSFGVRPGQLAELPVLLNDHDPNEDVLTIVPDSVQGLDAGIGTASLTTELERISLRVADDASGETSFQYTITDGTTGHTATATVTLRVVDDGTETAPTWCGGDALCAEVTAWPGIEVAPGGTGRAQVLSGWVDPESDPVYVSSVTKQNADDPGSVAVTEDGSVYYQHPDASSTRTAPVILEVTVSDALGQSTTRELTVTITATPTLSVAPFSVVTSVGRSTTIDPTAHITGVSGAFSLANASSADDTASVAVAADTTTLTFTAPAAGSFVVRFDVSDASTTGLSASVRVTVLPDDQLGLTAAPITVFVRPKLDTTVDVFTAVSNPADLLLVLTSATVQQNGQNSLFADVVDHSLLRVKGTTVTGGAGVLGTVEFTVSDGTADSGRQATGVATVILLDETDAQRPIAVDDSVVVRAGAQVDVSVLANDVSADGNALVLDPGEDAVSSTAEGGLAFASGSKLRLLAPDEAGTYTVRYTVYSAGSPAQADTGEVLVTVVATGENRNPQPQELDARVTAGQSVTISVPTSGVDPDGDAVRLSRIVSQPGHGAAAVASDGTSIVYTALDTSYAGTDEFSYEVRDGQGAVGTATVRVGILAARESSVPVTYTDYVQVEAGGNTAVVEPLANDIDPLGGTLDLVDFVPDFADATSTQYTAQAALVDSVDAGAVTLHSGDTAGTLVFRYTAQTADGLNAATGYVVVKVVASAVPDAPIVTDSYVSVDDRATFSSEGLDVVTGHVSWVSGDVNGLSLALWNAPAGYTVSGHRIAGPLPEQSLLIAFSLTGTDYQGDTVTSYGFLLVPGEDDIVLALRSDVGTVRVDENDSTSFDISTMVSVPDGATLEVDGGGVQAVLRAAASCTLTSGFTIRYDAGQGSPYADACVVPVRLVGQDYYTPLLVPIAVEAEQPIPLLKDASREVVPDPEAAAQSIDLMTMVSWAGEKTDEDDVQFTLTTPDAAVFDTSYDASTRTVSFAAKSSAVPGTRGTITVRFSGAYGSSTEVGLIQLTVGETPNVLPRGGSTTADCSIESATSCSVEVIGLAGEYNYFADAGALQLVQVQAASCPGVTFSIVGTTTIKASWSGTVDGVECTVRFVVADQAGTVHRSTGDGNGSVDWRFNGVPRAAASVSQVSYDDRTVQLAVDPGDARSAFPALTGFEITVDGGSKPVATCTVAGVCTAITTSKNLDHREYTAYAVNAEGRSSTGPSVEAWSYALPELGSVSLEPVYDAALTTTTKGAVRVTITGSEADVDGYQLTDGGTLVRTGDSTVAVLQYPVGGLSLTITPVTTSGPPSAQGPTTADAAETKAVVVAGSPILKSSGTVSATESSVTLTGVTINANSSKKSTQAVYFAYQSSAPSCSISSSGGSVQASGGDAVVSSSSSTVSGLDANEVYSVGACVTNGYGYVTTTAVSAFTAQNPGVSAAALQYRITDTGDTTTIDGTTYNTDGDYRLSIVDESAADPVDPAHFTAEWNNYDPDTNTASITGADPDISVDYCAKQSPSYCPASKDATALDSSRGYQLSVSGSSSFSCDAGLSGFSASGVGSLGGTPTVLSAEYLDADGNEVATDDDGEPSDWSTVYEVKDVWVGITWTDSHVSGLLPYAWDAGDTTCSSYVAPATAEPTDTATSDG